jgi:hypothetical protein
MTAFAVNVALNKFSELSKFFGREMRNHPTNWSGLIDSSWLMGDEFLLSFFGVFSRVLGDVRPGETRP